MTSCSRYAHFLTNVSILSLTVPFHQLYSLFKVGNGEDFSKVDKPGVFDLKVRPDNILKNILYLTYAFLQGKAKYNAWKKEVDAGTTADGAQQRYIALVDKLKSELGFSA